MGTKDKISNTTQDLRGKVKETVGKVTGNTHIEREGQADQVKAAVKDVSEKVKDAASTIKDAVTK